MTTNVPGTYKKGVIELHEPPLGIQDGPITVTLELTNDLVREPRYLQRGKYNSSGGRMSTPEDFKEAEWYGEPESD